MDRKHVNPSNLRPADRKLLLTPEQADDQFRFLLNEMKACDTELEFVSDRNKIAARLEALSQSIRLGGAVPAAAKIMTESLSMSVQQ